MRIKLVTAQSLLGLLFLTVTLSLHAQGIAVNTDGSDADASATLDVSSTEKGMLMPSMTSAQRSNISNPATGLLVFQTDGTAGFYYNSGTPSTPNWTQLSSVLITEIADADGDTKVQVEESADDDYIRFDVAGTEVMTIENSGEIGIGTNIPTQKLHVSHTTGAGQIINEMSGAAVTIWSTTGVTPYIGSYSNHGFSFVTNNQYRLTVSGTGEVGIGTTSPDASARLDIESTSKGFLPPRMTTAQINAISSPYQGLTAYNTDVGNLVFFDGTSWIKYDGTAM